MEQGPRDYDYPGSPLQISAIKEPSAGQRTQIGQSNQQPSKPPLWKRLTFWNVVFNCLLAITTIFLGFIAYWQYESSTLDQRAWVYPVGFVHPLEDEGGGPRFLIEGSRPKFGVVIKNTGKTPATNMKVMIGRMILPQGVPFIPKYTSTEGENISISVLSPGATATLVTLPESQPRKKEDIEILITRQYILYVYGSVTYEDIFRTKHESSFCGFLQPQLTGFGTCNTYNQAN